MVTPPADSHLWAGFNVLACGPPGSGKMSFVTGLALVSRPVSGIRVYDFQTEPEAQDEHINRLLASLRQAVSSGNDAVHVVRHLHRIKGQSLVTLAGDLAGVVNDALARPEDASPIRLHATCYDGVRWPSSVRKQLEMVFPCWIRMTENCPRQRDLTRFVRHVVRDLNRRYGRDVIEIDSEVIEALRQDARRSLHEMRNLIERVYIASEGRRMSKTALRSVI